jgi:septal ring factor EnvC (AmiA/AmiB activator)
MSIEELQNDLADKRVRLAKLRADHRQLTQDIADAEQDHAMAKSAYEIAMHRKRRDEVNAAPYVKSVYVPEAR